MKASSPQLDSPRRERIEKVQEAGPRSFDTGRFALLLEPLDGNGEAVVQEPPPPRPQSDIPRAAADRVPPALILCRGCEQYVYPETIDCPFCGGNVPSLAEAYTHNQAEIAAAAGRLRALLTVAD